MKSAALTWTRLWERLGPRYMPFADAATAELPMSRLLRLSLFQISIGIAVVLLNGTLNRVMVVELDVPVWLVSLMVSLPLVVAPFRVLIGFSSDHYRSLLGWRRVPYLWFGTLMQFGGLAIMPFALLLLSGGSPAPAWLGQVAAALAFLLVGAGLHTAQTAGLALATDLAPADRRPRVVALLYVMLLLGMVGSSLIFAALLDDFSNTRLIQVIQGAAVITLVINVIAMWQQEARNPGLTRPDRQRPVFLERWREFRRGGRAGRLLLAVGLGTAGFSMQDILLEPYGGEILGLSVGATTGLTALLAAGMLSAFAIASRQLGRGADPVRIAGAGAVIGIFAFAAVTLAAPLHSTSLFQAGTVLIGLGGGLFAVGTLTSAMALASQGDSGLALGAWGAVQATAAGAAIMFSGGLRDLISHLAESGSLGQVLNAPSTGYSAVYHLEIALLFAALVAIGPLVRRPGDMVVEPTGFGLADFPG